MRAVARASIARFVILAATAVALILLSGSCWYCSGRTGPTTSCSSCETPPNFLAGPFNGLVNLDSNKAEKAVNWGIAAVVWYALGRVIARLLLRR